MWSNSGSCILIGILVLVVIVLGVALAVSLLTRARSDPADVRPVSQREGSWGVGFLLRRRRRQWRRQQEQTGYGLPRPAVEEAEEEEEEEEVVVSDAAATQPSSSTSSPGPARPACEEAENARLVAATVPRGGGGACLVDEDCEGNQVCRPAGIYYPTRGMGSLSETDLGGQPVARVVLEALEERALAVEDVRAFVWQRQDWLLVSTNSRTLLLHSEADSRLVEANVTVGDVHISPTTVYGLSPAGTVYSLPLREAMRTSRWTLREAPGLPRGIEALEGTFDGEFMALITRDRGTYHVERGVVTRHLRRTLPVVLGPSKDDYLLFPTTGGVDVFPNRVHLDDVAAGVLTADNRLYSLDPTQNSWVKRMRSIGAEPVVVSHSLCVQPGAPDHEWLA